jgi:hypothetical protein
VRPGFAESTTQLARCELIDVAPPAPHGGGASVATPTTRKRLVKVSLLTGALVIVAQSVAHLIATVGFGVCDATGFAPCPSVFDLDYSNGISDIVSTAVIAAAALGAAVLGARRRPREVAALALAAVLLLVTVDDALHLEDNAWGVYGVIVIGTIVCAAALTARVAVGVSSGTRWLLLLGTAILALDAKAPYFYDQLMNIVGQPALGRGALLYELGVVLDEAMELAGWILLAVGLWDAALSVRPADAAPVRRAGPDMRDLALSPVEAQVAAGSTSRSASRVTSDA